MRGCGVTWRARLIALASAFCLSRETPVSLGDRIDPPSLTKRQMSGRLVCVMSSSFTSFSGSRNSRRLGDMWSSITSFSRKASSASSRALGFGGMRSSISLRRCRT